MKRIELSEDELNEQKVTLKPIFGIQPECYIKYVYVFLLLFVVFLVFILPGLLKNGTYYRFSSSPQGASVYADDIRLGATPGLYFVPRGEREITLKTPYHETFTKVVKVKGQVFGSLFIKRKKDFTSPLNFNLTRESLNREHLNSASWFQTDEGYSSQPLPPLMTGLMAAYYRSAQNTSEISEKDLLEYHISLLRSAAQIQAYRQWQDSAALFATKGKVLNPHSYLTAILTGVDFLKKNPGSLDIFKQYHTLDSIDFMDPKLKRNNGLVITGGTQSYQPLLSDPLQFRTVGRLNRDGQEYDIYAADREITKGWYALFLADHPEWTLSALDELMKNQWVDENYLHDWDSEIVPGRSREPLRFVSHPAAQAFCSWMEDKYFDSAGMTVRLPGEWEWEEIALVNSLKSSERPSQKNLGPLEAGSFQPGSLNLYDMEGNLWEWCENGFGMNDPFLYNITETSRDSQYSFPDFAVRGGSWANNPGQVNIDTRGSQPGSWCTAYVGLRPLLLVKR